MIRVFSLMKKKTKTKTPRKEKWDFCDQNWQNEIQLVHTESRRRHNSLHQGMTWFSPLRISPVRTALYFGQADETHIYVRPSFFPCENDTRIEGARGMANLGAYIFGIHQAYPV